MNMLLVKSPDLAVTARWGYPGQKGVTMPGPGKTTTGTRGEGFLDIHLNATTRWKDIPVEAWNYTLGGYQVLKSGSATANKPSSTAPSPPTKSITSPTTPAVSPPSSRRAMRWTRTTAPASEEDREKGVRRLIFQWRGEQ